MRIRLGNISLGNVLCYLYIFTLCFYGLIRHFFSFNLITDVAGALLVVYWLIKNRGSFTIKKKPITALLVLFVICCFVISLVSCYSIQHSFLGFRNYIFYIFFGFAVVNSYETKNIATDIQMLINAITFLGTLICLIGVIQFFYMDSLPNYLQGYYEAGQLYLGTSVGNIARSNGTVENSIVFSAFAAIMSIIEFGYILSFKLDKMQLIKFVICVLGTFFSASRISIAGLIACLALEYILIGKNKKIIRYLILIAVISISYIVLITLFSESYIVQRFLGNDTYVQASDDRHFALLTRAWDALKGNYLFGIGMGTQGYTRGSLSTIISDGQWLSSMLELGLPTTIVFFIILLVLIKKAMKALHSKNHIVAFLSAITLLMTSFYIVSSILNTAFLARCNYGMYWIVVALFLKAEDELQIPKNCEVEIGN